MIMLFDFKIMCNSEYYLFYNSLYKYKIKLKDFSFEKDEDGFFIKRKAEYY